MRYTTISDVIEQAIIPALGDNADDYDTEAIARETHEWKIDTDANGNELLNTGGFEESVDTDTFWDIVAKHDKTA